MGTRWSVLCSSEHTQLAEDLQAALQAAVDRVDHQMSPWIDNSDLCKFNRAETGDTLEIGQETCEVLSLALKIHTLSGGAFNPAVMPNVEAAGFSAQHSVAAFAAPGRLGDLTSLDRQNRQLTKLSDGKIDLCGIAKGYGVDQLAAVLREAGLHDFLASIDGELVASGRPAESEGWQIALEAPDIAKRRILKELSITDMCLATSGGYRNMADHFGEPITHTIDPRTGAPSKALTQSVTLAASTAAEADAWATAFTVLGHQAGAALADKLGLHALFCRLEHGVTTYAATGILAAVID